MPASPVSLFRFAVLALAQCSSPAWADVVIFTDARHPLISTGGSRVVLLDAPKQIEAALSENLPPDADKAASLVRARLAQQPELSKQIAQSYQGVLDAHTLGISKIPAVVVDRRYVVYGEPDVEAALAHIADYRNRAR